MFVHILSFVFQLKKVGQPMKTVGGRPRLTLHRLRSLAELQSFFHTVCHIGQSQGRGIRSHSLTPGSWQDRRVKAAGASGQSSKGSSNYEVDDEERVKNMTDREYIEHLIQLDFLETFHWNKNCIDLRLVNNMDGWLAEDFPVPSAGVPSAGFISTVIFIFSSSHTYTSLTLHWHFIDTSLTLHWHIDSPFPFPHYMKDSSQINDSPWMYVHLYPTYGSSTKDLHTIHHKGNIIGTNL